jgi:hypothetical protein
VIITLSGHRRFGGAGERVGFLIGGFFFALGRITSVMVASKQAAK